MTKTIRASQLAKAANRLVFFGACLLLALPSISNATLGQWVGYTPSWPSVTAMAVESSATGVVYVGVKDKGVFRSTDAGANWVPASNGLGSSTVTQLVSISAGVLYAISQTMGVYKTIDAGLNWTAINTGFPSGVIPSRLAAGASGMIYAASYAGVFKTTNSGATWVAANNGLEGQSIQDIAVVDAQGTVFASVYNFAVFKTTDGGAHWISASAGLPTSTPTSLVAVGSTVYVGSYWSGVYKTTDSGTSWTPSSNGLPVGRGVRFLARGLPGTLYAAVGDQSGGVGVYKSVDGGLSWIAANGGMNALQKKGIFEIGVDASGYVHANTKEGGVLKSIDGGASWTSINKDPFKPTGVTVLLPDGAGSLYAGSNPGGIGPGGGLGLFKTQSGGVSWESVAGDWSNLDIIDLVLDSAGAIYASTYWQTIFKSTDGGAHWTSASTGLPASTPTSLVADSAAVYVGSYWNGVSKTINGGTSWAASSNGLPSGRGVSNLALVGPDILYAAAQDQMGVLGIYKTANGGAQWTPANNGLANIRITDLLAEQASGIVYAGTVSGVYKTSDGGALWVPINTGLADTFVSALAISKAGALYAGTNSGVYRMPAGQASWSKLPVLGLSDVNILSLATDGYDSLYAGTSSGLFAYNVPPATSTALTSSANPTTVGQVVTFTATVTGNAPTGTVNFKEGGSTISSCAAVALNSGSAQCSLAFTTPGTKAILAAYSGDINNAASTGILNAGQAVNAIIAYSVGANGSISGSPPQTVAYGAMAVFTITANRGYVARVATGAGNCGGTLTGTAPNYTYTTNPITANCNVAVTFVSNSIAPILYLLFD